MKVLSQVKVAQLASRLQSEDRTLTSFAAVEKAIEMLSGQKAQIVRKKKPSVEAGTAQQPVLPPDGDEEGKRLALARKMRSIGIIDFDGRITKEVVSRALDLIQQQLSNPHVGLSRREFLIKMKKDLARVSYFQQLPQLQIFQGGLPSLGKRR